MSSYRIIPFSGTDPVIQIFKPMIFKDFMTSLRYGNDLYRLIDSDRYFAAYEQVINNLLNRADCVVRLAVLTEDNDNCLGWSICEGPILHYVYVKKDYRTIGIGKSLVPESINRITHITKTGHFLWQQKRPEIIFDPF